MTSARREQPAPNSFSYGRLIVETRLTGLSAMIACHCEPVFYNAEIPLLRLEVPEALDAMKQSPAMAQFKSALTDYFGEGLELELVEGPALGSPAAMSAARKIDGLVKAHESLMKDDVINKMLKDFGGKVLVETIEPLMAVPSKRP